MTSPPAGPEVVVIAHYTTRPDEADRVALLLAEHGSATRAEAGCRDFIALRGTEDAALFTLVERYVDSPAFDAHVASPHYRRIVRDTIRPLLTSRTVDFVQRIG